MSENAARGRRIRQAMVARNYKKTQAVATELDVSVAAVSRWQNGGHVSLQSVCEFAVRLDVSLDWLLLGRGDIDWHKDKQSNSIELKCIMSLRTQPPKIQGLLTDLMLELSGRPPLPPE